MNWKISTDIYTLSCVKQTTSGKLQYSTASLPWFSVNGWDGGGGNGREFQGGDICIYMADSLHCFEETNMM